MDAPGTSGRPPAGFASLSAWSLLCSTPVSGRQQNLSFESHVDYSSQQSSAPMRVPTTAWFPSFGRGGSVSNNWSNRPSSHKTFSYGLGAGAGGSMLVSLLPMLAYSNIGTRFISIISISVNTAAAWWIWFNTSCRVMAFQKQGYLIDCDLLTVWHMAAVSWNAGCERTCNACREGQNKRQKEDTCLDV